MDDDHEHNTNGARKEATHWIGKSKYTFEEVYCTCGKWMENNQIAREDFDQ